MNRDGKISIFAGHIKCGDCERAMSKKISGSYNGKKREKHHYMCSAYMRSGGTRCSKHSIRNDYTKEYGEQIRQSEDTIDKYYEELKEFDQASRESSWIEYFTKYKNVNSLSRELIDSLVDNIYIYEDKKSK